MGAAEELQRRNWAVMVAILAGVMSLGFAIWGAPLFHDEANLAARATGAGLTFAVAGVASVLGAVLAQRSARAGKLVVGLGGLVMLAGPFILGRPTGITWPIMLVLALAMLLASRFVGPIPRDIPPSR